MISESVTRTMMVAVAVALVCSALVSSAVFYLRPLQANYAALERNRTILAVADVLALDAGDSVVNDAFKALETHIYDLVSQSFSNPVGVDPRAYDHWTNALVELRAEHGVAAIGLGGVPRFVPVYMTREGNAIERLVLPLHGQGMWSTIYGYLALEADLVTVAAVRFHNHGETPGIGDRIENEQWLASWRGKKAFNEAGERLLSVSKAAGLDSAFRVDVISGATVTSEAVGRIVGYWLGPDGYGPLLRRLKEDEQVR